VSVQVLACIVVFKFWSSPWFGITWHQQNKKRTVYQFAEREIEKL